MSLDDEDRSVLKVLVRRAVAANERKVQASQELAVAEAGVADANLDFERCRLAFNAFGFDVGASGFWEEVRHTIGEDAWVAAHSDSKGNALPTKASLLVPPSLVDFVQAELQASGGHGATVAYLRATYEKRYLTGIAPQSVMSAIYKVARLLRREKRGAWYGLP